MQLLVVFLVSIGWMVYVQTQQATTTRKPHEPNEKEMYNFFYDYYTHKLLLTNNKICYIYHLHESEIASVHTDAGLTKIEFDIIWWIVFGDIRDNNFDPSSMEEFSRDVRPDLILDLFLEYKVFGLVSDAQLLDQAQPNHLPPSVVRRCGRNVTTYYQFLA